MAWNRSTDAFPIPKSPAKVRGKVSQGKSLAGHLSAALLPLEGQGNGERFVITSRGTPKFVAAWLSLRSKLAQVAPNRWANAP